MWEILLFVLLVATGTASILALHFHLQQHEQLERDALLDLQRAPDAKRYHENDGFPQQGLVIPTQQQAAAAQLAYLQALRAVNACPCQPCKEK